MNAAGDGLVRNQQAGYGRLPADRPIFDSASFFCRASALPAAVLRLPEDLARALLLFP